MKDKKINDSGLKEVLRPHKMDETECDLINPSGEGVEPVVGQKVWVNPSSLWRSRREPFEATVSKVGRKYFELTECPREKYDLETLRQVTETNYENKVYLKLQDILDEKEHQKLSDEIKRAFNGYGKLQYSLEQLRKIAEIVGLQ